MLSNRQLFGNTCLGILAGNNCLGEYLFGITMDRYK